MVKVKKIFVEGVVIKQLYILISKLSYNNCEYRLKRHYNKSLKPVWTTPTPFRIWLNIIFFLVCLLLIVSPWIKGNLVQSQQEMVKVKILISSSGYRHLSISPGYQTVQWHLLFSKQV